jgi:hypothetical protein
MDQRPDAPDPSQPAPRRALRYARSAVLLLAILALVLLASGLRDVNFAEPRQFSRAESENISFSVAALVEGLASIPRWKQVLFWVGVYLLVLILTSILSPELRKRLLWATARLAILSLAILYLVQNRERFGLMNLEPLDLGGLQITPQNLDLAPPVFSPPSIPPALTYLISVAVILLTIGLFWLFGRGFSARRMRPAKDLSLEDIAAAARASLRDLSTGRDWEDSILRCYESMTEVVARKRGFHRDPHLTPSEFAAHLEQSGLPAEAVRRLTRLFESVRYGAHTSGERESAEAADCLREVLRYCREAV